MALCELADRQPLSVVKSSRNPDGVVEPAYAMEGVIGRVYGAVEQFVSRRENHRFEAACRRPVAATIDKLAGRQKLSAALQTIVHFDAWKRSGRAKIEMFVDLAMERPRI